MSSKNYPETRMFTGVFDENPELSPLATANKAYVSYCSSDAFAGNQDATDQLDFEFKGQKIVQSALVHLINI
jgi:hypothetical protein